MIFTVCLALCLHQMVGVAIADKGKDLPEAVKSSIERRFPVLKLRKLNSQQKTASIMKSTSRKTAKF